MIQHVHHDGVLPLARNFSHDSSSSGNVSPAVSDISLQHDDQDDFMNDNVISISPGVPNFNIVTSEGSSSSSTNGNVGEMSCPLDIKMGFEELCPVCGDKVSGYHYGLLTCESCKGFFKRTVQNKKVYSCVDNRNCHIDKSQRKRCPYCRFQKCLRVGMKLEAVRSDRMRGGRNKFGPMYKRDRALKQQAMRQQQQLIASCQMRLTEGMTPDQLSMMEDIKPNPALLMAAANGTLNGQFPHSANINSPQFNMNSSRVSPSLSAVNLMNSLPEPFSLSTDYNMNGISRGSISGGGGVMRGRSSSQLHISNGVGGGNAIGSLMNSPNSTSQGNHHYSGQSFPSPTNTNVNTAPHPAHNPHHHHHNPSSNNNNTNSSSNGVNGSIYQLQNHHVVNNNNNINNNPNSEDLRLSSHHSNGINSGGGTISTSHINLHHNHHHNNNSSSGHHPHQNHMRMSSSGGGALLRRPLSYDSQMVPIVPPLIKDMQSSMVDDTQIQQKLSTFIEPEMDELQMTSSPDKLMHIVCQIADQCLFVLVEWARNSTFFKDIKVEDQMKLLQNCWSELILLDFIYRQVKEYWTDEYVLASGHHFSTTYLDKLGLNDVKDRLQELVKKMRDLKMDYNEYICLRFLILLNPDVADVEGRHYIELCQEQVNASLLEYCMNFYPDMKDKFGQVLLRLPEIRLISIRLEEYLYFRHLNGEVPEQTLLMEMLHSKRK